MKRILAAALLLAALWGCARQQSAPTAATAPAETAPSLPTLPADTGQTLPPPPEPQQQETRAPETLPTLPEFADPDEPRADTLVRILDYIPDIQVELAYAGEENFTGQIIYESHSPWLRYGTVLKLQQVQQELKALGLTLRIWDAFRPAQAQFWLWHAYPDETYVANPNRGYSDHTRGNTLDLTLARIGGEALEMPTGFDDFSPLADRNYRDCTPEAAENARLLEDVMERCGFTGYRGEWWHFTDTDAYPVETGFTPAREGWYRTRQDTALLAGAQAGETLAQIPAGQSLWLLAWDGEYAYVCWQEQWGFVPLTDLRQE